jgi:hypothetical protein
MLQAYRWPIVALKSVNMQKGNAMSVESIALADEVVSSFQALLDSNAREAVGDANFHALHGAVREAIARQSKTILERLEQDLEQIESEMVERLPLEL